MLNFKKQITIIIIFVFSICSTLQNNASKLSDNDTTFSHDFISLTLPAGWYSDNVPKNSPKELIAWLKSKTIEDASILLYSYKGIIYDNMNMRMKGLNTIKASFPLGQKLLKEPYKVKTESGDNARVELWLGTLEAGGQTINLQSPMGIVKIKNRWFLFIGFASESSAKKFEYLFLKIIKSAREP